MLQFKPPSETDKIRYGTLSLIYAPFVASLGYVDDKPHWLIIGLVSWLLVVRLDYRHIRHFVAAGGVARSFCVTVVFLMACSAAAPFADRVYELQVTPLLVLVFFCTFFVAWVWAPRVYHRHGVHLSE